MTNINIDNTHIILAFDFGLKRIGVAIGQTITKSARPLKTLPAKDGVPIWEEVKQLIQTWRPDTLIVGIPLNMDGSEQVLSQKARQFRYWLAEQTNLPVYEVDERLTTKAAREILFQEGGFKALQGGQVDQVAAKLILEHWLSNLGE